MAIRGSVAKTQEKQDQLEEQTFRKKIKLIMTCPFASVGPWVSSLSTLGFIYTGQFSEEQNSAHEYSVAYFAGDSEGET